ncbi:MAG: 3-phosphoshikimate 1-carboxyvinyltransferase [Deltaproteobacteria bacterium]|nr:3-phosphoshikimate 1-carboxyvinyltransferase [Deltaproteobacteria bacterium]
MTNANEKNSITISAANGLRGEIFVPGDKSISHRAVILGSIAEGVTEVYGFLEGEDNLSTLNAFRQMGVEIEYEPSLAASYVVLKIHGAGAGTLKEPSNVIDARNSGTTARLLTGLLSSQPFFSVITGDDSLRKRPMRRVVEPLIKMGASITGREDARLLPLAIKGQRLHGINYKTPVASAQLKSAILLASLHADGETIVEEMEKSRDHTERMLKAFGADIRVEGLKVTVTSKNKLKGCKVYVPGDISSAAFFMVGAMITPDSDLLMNGVGVNPTRTGIIDILRKMGGNIDVEDKGEETGEPVANIRVKTSSLKGIDISGPELLPAIDEFPIICIAEEFASGRTTISWAVELRVKESDRIAVMSKHLRAMGVEAIEKTDGIIIEGYNAQRLSWQERVEIDSMGDHRIAMSFAIAGLMATKGITIKNPECADVSFLGFYETLKLVSV